MTAPGSVLALLSRLRAQPSYVGQIQHVHKVAGSAACYDSLAYPLHPVLAQAFQQALGGQSGATGATGVTTGATATSSIATTSSGVTTDGTVTATTTMTSEATSGKEKNEGDGFVANSPLRLYAHQVQAINALREGRHVIISTPTASGENQSYVHSCVSLELLNSIWLDQY